jgi:heme/copper-type cytochrome/quinol oxidase subunit 2
MSRGFRSLYLAGALPALVFLIAMQARSVWACAACYGQSDAPMAQGMNWGILSLMGIIVLVLGGVAGFFVYLARRAAELAVTTPPSPLAESTERT